MSLLRVQTFDPDMVALGWGRFVNKEGEKIQIVVVRGGIAFYILNVQANTLKDKNTPVSYGKRHIVDPVIKETKS